METADSSLACIPGSIALDKAVHQAVFTDLSRAVGPSKQASTVRVRLRFDDPGSCKLCRDELHYLVQKKSPSICRVRIRYSSCFSRVNDLNWNTSSVISMRLKSSSNCCAPRLAS